MCFDGSSHSAFEVDELLPFAVRHWQPDDLLNSTANVRVIVDAICL